MEKKEISKIIFDYLATKGLKVKNVISGNGYYLFDFGEDSVYHFRLKGAKRWKIGLWIVELEEEGKYRISLFAEHNDYIDKFKPTQTEISSEFEMKNDELPTEDILNRNLGEAVCTFLQMTKASYRTKYKLYKRENEKFLHYFWNDTIWNKIIIPFNEFKRKHLSYLEAKLFAFLLKLRHRRLITNGYRNKDFYYPAATLKVSYDNYTDEDDVYDIYHSKFLKMIDKISRNNHWEIAHYRNSNDKRSFFYN